MKVYVIGASKEMGRVRLAMAALRQKGIEITHDWMAHKETHAIGGDDRAARQDARKQGARDNVRGIDTADLIWMLVPEAGVFSDGAFFELGYAVKAAQGRAAARRELPIVISGADFRRTIFTELVDCVFQTDEDAMQFIVTVASHHDRRAAQTKDEGLTTEREPADAKEA